MNHSQTPAPPTRLNGSAKSEITPVLMDTIENAKAKDVKALIVLCNFCS
jgi:hypothetical protein